MVDQSVHHNFATAVSTGWKIDWKVEGSIEIDAYTCLHVLSIAETDNGSGTRQLMSKLESL